MLKIAIPNKGRMQNPTLDLLKKAGYEAKNFNQRKLCIQTKNKEITLLLIRTEDIGSYVEKNIADLGITGFDLIIEKKNSVEKILDLNYGQCQIVLAGLNKKKFSNGVKIASKYKNITREYLKEKKIQAEIINSNGSTEINPKLGLADFIIDLTSTGSTLKMNDLEIYDVILKSNAVLIANKKSLIEKKKEINDFKLAFESVILAENKSYIMFNITKETLERIIDQIPCMKSPTIVNTGDKKIVSVQTVVPTDDVTNTISKLREFGSTDMLVFDIKRVVV